MDFIRDCFKFKDNKKRALTEFVIVAVLGTIIFLAAMILVINYWWIP